MDSYRPHSRAGHRFRTFHMFVDELCLQLIGTTAQQSTAFKPGPSNWARDGHWPLLGSASSVVCGLLENSEVTNKNHMLFMHRFYNSVGLFHLLKNELGVLAAGTVMPSRKHYPKELSRRLTERGRYKFWCRGALCAIAWKDR